MTQKPQKELLDLFWLIGNRLIIPFLFLDTDNTDNTENTENKREVFPCHPCVSNYFCVPFFPSNTTPITTPDNAANINPN